jgi:hypothetical protein
VGQSSGDSRRTARLFEPIPLPSPSAAYFVFTTAHNGLGRQRSALTLRELPPLSKRNPAVRRERRGCAQKWLGASFHASIVGAEFVADHGRLNYNSVGIMRNAGPLDPRAPTRSAVAHRPNGPPSACERVERRVELGSARCPSVPHRAAQAKCPAVHAAIFVWNPLGIRQGPPSMSRSTARYCSGKIAGTLDQKIPILDIFSDNRQIDSSFFRFFCLNTTCDARAC